MHEFEAVSVSSYEAGSLAAKLTEKSNEGWDVVAIVPAGSDITAYLKRTVGGGESAAASASDATSAAAAVEAVVNSGTAPAEPAGWGSAPSSTTAETGSGSTGGWGSNTDSSTTSGWGATSTPAASGGWGSTASTPASPAVPAQPATPAVAADWYADPAGRYELRYWNGTAWTEHVSRNGQQFTDPPVA